MIIYLPYRTVLKVNKINFYFRYINLHHLLKAQIILFFQDRYVKTIWKKKNSSIITSWESKKNYLINQNSYQPLLWYQPCITLISGTPEASLSGFLTPSGTAATVGHVPWGPEQDTVNELSSTTQGQEQGFPQAAQWVMTPSTKQEIQEMSAQSLEQEDHLEKKMATHSSILAWRIPWTEESGRLQSLGSQELDTT